MLLLKKVVSFLLHGQQIQTQQVRHVDSWRMLKDLRKRQAVEKHGRERQRLMAMSKSKVLPPELKELAAAELAAFPIYSRLSQLRRRCSLTSRGRGTITPYRISRIVFRHLADYNKLAGVMRARW